MIFRQKVIVDWEREKQRRIKQAEANNKRENSRRIAHNYEVGQMVLLVVPKNERAKQPKISSGTEGPFEILKVFSNGTLEIQRGAYADRVSIRRVRPYYAR